MKIESTDRTDLAVMSPKVRRAIRKDALATALDRALREHGTRRDVLASDLGVCPSKLVAWTTAGTGQSIPACDLAAMPLAVLRDLLRPLLDAHGLALVELPGAVPMSSAKAAARFVREGGDAAATTIEALADGVMSPDEGRAIVAVMGDVIEAAVTLREFAREATKVVPLKRRA